MEITVGMGEIKVTENPGILIAIGIGSCVAAVLYDRDTRIGGLAHIVLPYIEEAHDKSHPAKFIDIAIHAMIDEMNGRGAKIQNIRAKIFGGSNMFPDIIFSNSPMNIGNRNISAVIQELKSHNIEIVASEVGDRIGRTVLFDTKDGSVLVKTANLEERRY